LDPRPEMRTPRSSGMGGRMVAEAMENAILRRSLVAASWFPHNGDPMRRLLTLFVIASVQAACSGSVVDPGGTSTSGGAGAGGGLSKPLACGDVPTVGQIVSACVPMNGDFCLPATNSPGLLVDLANANGVCPETSSTACCGKPAYRQVVCDQPPGVSNCCYDVHFMDQVVCP
jgi:hypothetical protein